MESEFWLGLRMFSEWDVLYCFTASPWIPWPPSSRAGLAGGELNTTWISLTICLGQFCVLLRFFLPLQLVSLCERTRALGFRLRLKSG